MYIFRIIFVSFLPLLALLGFLFFRKQYNKPVEIPYIGVKISAKQARRFYKKFKRAKKHLQR